jgi:transposase InsO family protein
MATTARLLPPGARNSGERPDLEGCEGQFVDGVFANHQAVDSPALLTLANSCEDFVVRAREQERRGEQVVDGHVQFSGQSGHGTLRIVKLVPIIDEDTRECLTSLVERSVTADALIDELDRLALTRGYPAVLRCDNGPELACEAMADRAGEHVVLSFIPPGEPWRNGYVESFNGRVRDECANKILNRATLRITDGRRNGATRWCNASWRTARPPPSSGPPLPAREFLTDRSR